jgi:biotin carboxyl carrier protein
MAERTLIARIHEDGSGLLIVGSPVVGLAHDVPRAGIYLNPLDRVLTVRILGRRHVVRLPRDVHGRITQVFIPAALTPVGFDEPLLRLDPKAMAIESGRNAGGSDSPASDSPGGDLIAVTAPTEGIFYRRPSPGSPAYVETGSRVAAGAVLGMVEVMKCFNQITYGGPGLPEHGEIVKVMAEDVSEVQFGQVLFWVKPAD